MPNLKYKVSLRLPDKIYSKSAETILEALNEIHVENTFKTKGVICVKYGKKYAELLLPIPMMKKLLVNQLSRELLQKRLLLSLK